MARIQTPQHVQELQAEFKIREQFGLDLLETVQPTFSLGDDKIASTGYPRKCMALMAAGAGGVGTNMENIITCPANIGIVIRVDEIWVSDVGGSFTLRSTDGVAPATVSATIVDKTFRDGRVINQLPDAVLQTANPLTAAPNGRLIGLAENIADVTSQYKVDFILGGGAYFLVRHSSANAGLTIMYLWTEYLLEDR